MAMMQWIVAAGTAAFVAIIGLLQLRTAQEKAALDLFERRHEIFTTIRASAREIRSRSQEFDRQRQSDFLSARERSATTSPGNCQGAKTNTTADECSWAGVRDDFAVRVRGNNGHRVLGCPFGRSPHWLKSKNPASEAVRRKAEEGCGR